MDFLRSCYSSTWLFPEKPTQPVRGYYYFCDPGTPHYNQWHYFGSRNWRQNDNTPLPQFGELQGPQTWRDGSFPLTPKPDARVIGSQDCIENGNEQGTTVPLTLLAGVDARCWQVPPIGGGIKIGEQPRSQTVIGGLSLGGIGHSTNPPVFSGGLKKGGQGRGQVVAGGVAIGGSKLHLAGGIKIGGSKRHLAGGLLLGGTGPLYALNLRQHQAQNTGGAPPFSFNLAWSPATVAHSWLFAAIGVLGTSAAPTVTPPAGWLYAMDFTSGRYHNYIFYQKNAPVQTSSGPFIVTVGGTNAVAVVNQEWQGFTSASAGFDQSASAIGTSANPATGQVTPSSSATMLALSSLLTENAGTLSAPTNGYNLVQGGPSNPTVSILSKMVQSAAPTSSSVTNAGGSTPWIGIIATFKV